MREQLTRQLAAYIPCNEQEAADKATILRFLQTQPDIFERSNQVAHMTASAWVVNPARTHVLMAYHNLYRSWAWLGGHADGETNLLAVALREVREESGIQAVRPVDGEILSVEVLTVDGHEKKGHYVPSHLHLNLTYLIEADDAEAPHAKPDENSAVGWFTPEDAIAHSSEAWFRQRIYPKLNAKLR